MCLVDCGLQIDGADVEGWVVKAIARGLLDGRMDQTARTVTVTRAAQRVFGDQEWSALRDKLRGWRDSVSGLLAVMRPESAAASTAATATGPNAAGAINKDNV
jgi:translation initiation factor 3 subunit M